MQTRFAVTALSALTLGVALTLSTAAAAQSTSFLSSRIDEAQRIALPGNAHPAAIDPSIDRGPAAAALPVRHLLLQLQRNPAREAAMSAYITNVDDATSPSYHKWLTAQQVGELYGPSHEDITEVVTWLAAKGLTINMVYPTGMVIDFSGTAAQVDAAFHLGLHAFVVGGETRVASTRRPTVPMAFAGIVGGIVNPAEVDAQALHHSVQSAHVDARRAPQTPRVATQPTAE